MKTQREQIVGAITSTATKAVAGKLLATASTKVLSRAGHPALLAGDVIEIGSRIICDNYGVEDRTAETVSNMAGAGATAIAGATLGAVGGPFGAMIGAGTGLGFWFIGKVASEAVARVQRQPTQAK